MVSDQTKLRLLAILNVKMSVEKWLLNGHLTINQKLWRVTLVVLFIHKKDGTKNSSGLQFNAQHLKSMVYVLGKINLFSSVLRTCVAV